MPTKQLVTTGYPSCAKAITPHDSNDLTDHDGTTPVPQMVRAGAAGNVVVIPAGQTTSVTFTLAAGEFVPVMCSRVLSTGTSATGLVGIF